MFDIPGLETMSSILGGAGPAIGGLGGLGAGSAIADAASSAWDFGSNAIANIGPGLIGGPFMPSFGGGGSSGVGAAGGGVSIGGPASVSGQLSYGDDLLY